MERRAQILLVVVFLVVSAAGLFWFLRWISPTQEEAVTRRTVQFKGSVSGLSVGSEVRYLGVPVGRVLDIDLAPRQPDRVDVVIGLDRELPDPGNLLGSLEPLGITGLSLIELRNREPGSVTLDVAVGVIPGQPSAFSAVPGEVSRVVQKLDVAISRVNALLTEQTVEDLGVTIHQLRTLTGNLTSASGEADTLVSSLGRVSARIESLLPAYESLAVRVESEVIPTVVDTGQSIRTTSDSLAATLGENRAEVRQLLEEDLPSLSRLGHELARTVEELSRLVENINDQPGALLYGEPVIETEIPLD